MSEEWCATVAAGIQRGCDDGSIRLDADPEEAAQILITLVDGLCTRWLAGAIDRERARELLRGAIERILR